MQNGWVLSKIISSEFFVTLIVSILGILTVSGAITVSDPNSTGELIAKAIAAIVTMVSTVSYGVGRVEVKKEAIKTGSTEVLG